MSLELPNTSVFREKASCTIFNLQPVNETTGLLEPGSGYKTPKNMFNKTSRNSSTARSYLHLPSMNETTKINLNKGGEILPKIQSITPRAAAAGSSTTRNKKHE